MVNFFKRALVAIAVTGGALFTTATPAFANANTPVICGWDMQDPKTGARYGYCYRNDLIAKSQSAVMRDDRWLRAQHNGRSHYVVCDGQKVVFTELQNKKSLVINELQLNCLAETPYN